MSDMALGAVLLVLSFPVVLLCSFVIVLELRGSPFVLQERRLTPTKHVFTTHKSNPDKIFLNNSIADIFFNNIRMM
jgi:lipopolysaccharide/colanic/teichoic acid biosynthesis glycosyltransferase